MTNLKTGDKAPDFNALIENGTSISLADFLRKKVDTVFLSKRHDSGLHCRIV